MPDWRREIRSRLKGPPPGGPAESEIVEELAQHLEDLYERALAGGADEEEARRAALAELSESDLLAHEPRRARALPRPHAAAHGAPRSLNMIGDLWHDARYAVRMLRKNPAFTAVAVIALALGIGANTSIFSVVNTVLLRPLPYKEPDRLVMVYEDRTKQGYPRDTPAAGNFTAWREQNQVFEGMAAVANLSINLTGAGEPERLEGRRVSASLFPLLGVEPQLGRAFTPEEDQPGQNAVVLLSHGLWQRRFGGDPAIVGRQLTLGGYAFTVVGVMPAHFQFPAREDELWIPIAFTPQEAANRNRHFLQVVARLKPGVTLEQARAEMSAIAARMEQQYPDTNTRAGAALVPLHEQVVGDIRPALLLLLGAVGLVLLIACANVANLLLARAAARQEIALRVALGASRLRLVRQFLTESLLLALVGGGVGLLLSLWGVNVLKAFIPESISQARELAVDGRVLGFTLLVSLLTGLVFGLAPAAQASRFNLNETLKEGGRDSSAGRRGNRLRNLLVVVEVAVSLVLLVGAGLLINSFLRLRGVDPGFRADNLLTMAVQLPQSKYPGHARRSAFYDEMLRRVESLPGVQSATVTNWIPLVRQGDSMGVSVEGQPDPAPGQGNRPSMVVRVVSPRYFETMGIQLLQGRPFDARTDRADSPNVVVISEAAARKFWPNEGPLGKRLTTGPTNNPDGWLEVVGVARDVRQFRLDAEPKPQMYLSYAQADFFAPRHLVVRADAEPLSLAGTVRQTVWGIDRDQPVSQVRPMEEVLSDSIARQRFSMLLLGIFAGVALILAAVGIYGVMSYTVAQRTHEIGIRLALGAQKRDVLRLAVGQGLRLVLIGVAIGLVAAVALTRLMSSLLFGVSATDPVTLAAISALLVAVAALASYIPARRATKVGPMIALRYQ